MHARYEIPSLIAWFLAMDVANYHARYFSPEHKDDERAISLLNAYRAILGPFLSVEGYEMLWRARKRMEEMYR